MQQNNHFYLASATYVSKYEAGWDLNSLVGFCPKIACPVES